MCAVSALKNEAVSEDSLLDGTVILRQPVDGYRAAIDPVFLAAAVAARPGELVLDAGCGVGAVGLCLARRVAGVTVTGLEYRQDLAALGRENALRNGLQDRVRVVAGDILDPPRGLEPGSFHQVAVNPPFLEANSADPPPDTIKREANVEGAARLGDWVFFALSMAAKGGGITFIHRADRLGELLSALEEQAGGIVVFPLWPRAGKAAKRVLVSARKGSSAPLRMAPGLVLHMDGADGAFTPEAQAVLRGGRGLEL
ncbi:MAG: methyltransferase [Alphaproteobacteria bacterium]|nr:methyltransferase [Alphaproteobacteria bacterium]